VTHIEKEISLAIAEIQIPNFTVVIGSLETRNKSDALDRLAKSCSKNSLFLGHGKKLACILTVLILSLLPIIF
jgi:hypothetical protein